MNYYEHHIGDYAEATSHLTFVEDAAYSRLIRKYYATEKPLPSEIKSVQRLVGARSKEEREAVETMLKEFFVLEVDGWHQLRCDDEIQRFRDGEPEREAKKANEQNRTKHHREERSRLFKILTSAGKHAPWNIGINELRAMVSAIPEEPETPKEPSPETKPVTPVTQPVTATATPVTATQTPDTRHQTPVCIPTNQGCAHEKFQMHTEWKPSDKFWSVARLSGLAKIEDDKFLAVLGEFIAYWLTQQDTQRTSLEWEHALVKSLKSNKFQGNFSSKTQRGAGTSAQADAAIESARAMLFGNQSAEVNHG